MPGGAGALAFAAPFPMPGMTGGGMAVTTGAMFAAIFLSATQQPPRSTQESGLLIQPIVVARNRKTSASGDFGGLARRLSDTDWGRT